MATVTTDSLLPTSKQPPLPPRRAKRKMAAYLIVGGLALAGIGQRILQELNG